MKTKELTGIALDWAVARCLYPEWWDNFPDEMRGDIDDLLMDSEDYFTPSTNWVEGGPIIEHERLMLNPEVGKDSVGNAWYAVSMCGTDAYGPTPLIAAMRCLVSAKLGDEVEIPVELTGEMI